ncbi:hypothetical protein [Methylobacterium soli]|uniref:Uncharacterized protein n=1 Tax=Methylobacterium soli TaxID=553447 RepID=A0A6L3SWT6_9HYPH|nr:hypothetical protein [Methylobacterium soli]KAB1076615.1 hypothetical protein F6X53_22200 [Methylobacterium soli]
MEETDQDRAAPGQGHDAREQHGVGNPHAQARLQQQQEGRKLAHRVRGVVDGPCPRQHVLDDDVDRQSGIQPGLAPGEGLRSASGLAIRQGDRDGTGRVAREDEPVAQRMERAVIDLGRHEQDEDDDDLQSEHAAAGGRLKQAKSRRLAA